MRRYPRSRRCARSPSSQHVDPNDGGAPRSAAGRGRSLPGRYVVATTVSWFAGDTVACVPTVVSQLTLPAVFVQSYQVPPLTSWILTVPALVGAIVNVVVSMLFGLDAFRFTPPS